MSVEILSGTEGMSNGSNGRNRLIVGGMIQGWVTRVLERSV